MSTIFYLVLASLVLGTALVIFRYVRRDYLRHGRLTAWTAALQCAVFGLHAALLYLALIETAWPKFPDSLLVIVPGALCAAVGLSILFAAFGVYWSPARAVGRRVDVLKQTGIYRWTRNPQIVGYGLFLLAFLILWPSWRVGVTLVVYAGTAHRMVTVEEEYLGRVFGEEYGRYCEKTARWVGFRTKR